MRRFAARVAVSVPITITISQLAGDAPGIFVPLCFGFVSYLAADLAVSNWEREK